MTHVAFEMPPDLAGDIDQRAGKLGMTASSYIATKLKLWIAGEDHVDQITDMLARLNQQIDEISDDE